MTEAHVLLRPGESPALSLAALPDEPSADEATACGEQTAGQRSVLIPPEVIQQRVREHYEEFRTCYESGLARDPSLEGRVTARFVIGLDGKVNFVRISENTLPDCAVVACVRSGYSDIVFPAPVRPMPVTVIYPIMFTPG